MIKPTLCFRRVGGDFKMTLPNVFTKGGWREIFKIGRMDAAEITAPAIRYFLRERRSKKKDRGEKTAKIHFTKLKNPTCESNSKTEGASSILFCSAP